MKKNLLSTLLALGILLSGAQSLKCTQGEALNIRGMINNLWLHGSLDGNIPEVASLINELHGHNNSITNRMLESNSNSFIRTVARLIIFGTENQADRVISRLNDALLALGAGPDVVRRDRNFYAQSFLSFYHFDGRAGSFDAVKEGISKSRYKRNPFIANFAAINGTPFKAQS